MCAQQTKKEPSIKTEHKLEYPESGIKGFLKNHCGPSLVWALLGIGGSHIVLSPTLGGTYGLIAIWILGFIYLVKYGCWELGIRYNYASGNNIIDGYSRIPGPNNWAVWLSLLAIINATIFNTAAVGISAATFAMIGVPLDTIPMYVGLLILTGAILIAMDYEWMERFLLLFVILLVGLIVLSVMYGPPSGDVVGQTLFNVGQLSDAAFIALFASAAGLAPTALSSSLMLGSWSITKNGGAKQVDQKDLDISQEEYDDYISKWIQTGLRDFKIGYLFSFVLIISLAVLSANIFYPSPPSDEDLALQIGQLLSGSFGAWSFYVVIIGAFAALWSTVIAQLDGGSRVVLELVDELSKNSSILGSVVGGVPTTERANKIVVVLFLIASMIPVIAVGGVPVTLVIMFGLSLIILEVFVYPANLYIVKNDLPEKFQPSTKKVQYYLIAIGLMVLFGILGAAGQLGFI